MESNKERQAKFRENMRKAGKVLVHLWVSTDLKAKFTKEAKQEEFNEKLKKRDGE